jgi:hypothetical protein
MKGFWVLKGKRDEKRDLDSGFVTKGNLRERMCSLMRIIQEF